MAAWKRTSVRNIPQYQRDEELENLLVFGYECKLFRDDAKAKYLDQGRHLIPWMGDPSLMIDRYDGRGHLHDLRPYDADYVVNNSDDLSEEEKRIEELCDEERYLELHTDVVEKQIYEEEELKRLNEAISDGYSAVAFNYDQSQAQEETPKQEEIKVDEAEAEPFYAPPELQLPPDVIPPETVKQNAIIEKTALFVSKHSAQMEIVIKTKQKNNPQFAFLEYNNELNPYYKHVVKMIKSAKYQPYSQRERHDSQNDNTSYLHPSLTRGVEEPPAKEQTREEFMRSVSSKLPSGQIANTPYAKLLSNLTRHTEIGSPGQSVTADPTAREAEGGIVQSASSHSLYGTRYDHCEVADVTSSVHIQSDALCSNGQPPPPGTVPPGPLPGLESTTDSSEYQQSARSAYSHVVPPPPDLQPVIDKMAIYVAKNGPEFELIVRRKNDARFEFLNAGHVHNAYYEHKKKLYQEEIAASKSEKVNGRDMARQEKNTQQNKSISFSLRSKENVETLSSGLRTTALLYESSSDEEDGSEKTASDDKTDGMPVTTQTTTTTTNVEVNVDSQSTDEADKKHDEARIKDKLTLAAREKLAQASKENQIKAERKRRAAMFINMLKSSQNSTAITQESTSNVSAPVTSTANSNTASPQVSNPQSPASTTTVDTHTTVSLVAAYQTRSPSITHLNRVSRSPSPRNRSRSPRRWSPRKHSRSRSPIRRRKRSRTPPSAYTRLSPVSKHYSHSLVPGRYKHRRSRSRDRDYSSKLKSATARSRSRSRSKTRTKSPSRRSHKSSRSHGKSSSRKRSRSRSRTRKHSRSRKRSRSRSKSRKSKLKKKKYSSSRSPKKKRSEEKKSHRKKKSSSRHEHRASSKEIVTCSSDSETVVIPDNKSEQSEIHTKSPQTLVIESDGKSESSASSSPDPSRTPERSSPENEKRITSHSSSPVNSTHLVQELTEKKCPGSEHSIQSVRGQPSSLHDHLDINSKVKTEESAERHHNDTKHEIDMFAE